MKKVDSVERLLAAYAAGERYFVDCDLDGDSLLSVNLSGATFNKCFLSCDFSGSDLRATHFEKCNLKTASFARTDLTDAVIVNCSVESIDFKGANVAGLQFERNYYMGGIVEQRDLAGFC